jgi:hypothetical protein
LSLVHFREVLNCRELLVLVAVEIRLSRRKRGPSGVEKQALTCLGLQLKGFAGLQDGLAMLSRCFLVKVWVLPTALREFADVCSVNLRFLVVGGQEGASV